MPQYELNLRDYLRIFRKRRLIIFVTFLSVTFLSVIFLLNQPVEYEASATIKIEERKTIAGLLTEWIVYNPANVMESEAKFINSFPVMLNVGLRGKLIKPEWVGLTSTIYDAEEYPYLEQKDVRYEFGPDVNQIISRLQSSVRTERIGTTNIIRIIVTSNDAEDAMDKANTVAEVYKDANLKEKAKQATQARKFIKEQLDSLEERLKDTEKELRDFGDNVKDVKLAEPIQQKLVELEFQLAEMLQKFTEKHPRVIQLRQQIREMESQVKGFSGQELQYARLNREVDVNKKLYAMLKEKLEEARITEAQKVGDVSIVNPAVLPQYPLSGNNAVKFVIGALLGLILGISFAFIFETLDTSIGTIEDVESVVKLPVLGVIPSFNEASGYHKPLWRILKQKLLPERKTEIEEKNVRLMAHYKPRSPITEAYRNIHTNLKIDANRKTLLVTSSSPREGKSSVVCNLGIVMAQVGLKTVLLSTDLRRPILAKTFGIRNEPGLNELVMGTAKLEEVLKNITDIMLGDMSFEDIRKTPGIENIWILPVGHIPVNPVELLESKGMDDLISTLKKQFDVIIMDSPPVLPVTDANILAPKVDSVIIIYEIGRTSREAVLRTKIQLEAVGAKIAGIVLNHTRPQTENISTYPYYNYKYKYYGKTEKESEQKT